MPLDHTSPGQESRDTKDRILDAAEELFGDQGYASTSLRSVTGLADVNLAAVHYHFGSKVGLFEAVFTRRVSEINDERLNQLDALEAPGRPEPTIEELLGAFLVPVFRRPMAKDPTWPRFQRFVGRVLSETGEHVEAMSQVFRGVQLRFVPAFHGAVSHLTERDVLWRTHLMVGSMCNMLSDPTRIAVLSNGACDGSDIDETLRQMIAFFAAGMRAPAATRPVTENSPVPPAQETPKAIPTGGTPQ
ncbi:MAG: AcrR family transcriptional regulator [Planctomycetota bacterium]|jgi:AcrR family transcriptional regulator